ncbi:B3GN6 acetylglucosaminyltransferase, partial [Oenanthe oenanthe]|nr:B3GN6 acetylglucosaminyltransferase [Oenanthe oenanthe]
LLTLVPSAPSYRDRRRAVRDTWGSPSAPGTLPRRTVFVLGLPGGAREQRRLLAESRQHRDIL